MKHSAPQASALAREFQGTLLHSIEQFFKPRRISKAIRSAFNATPRHRFLRRFYSPKTRQWIALSDENLAEHLGELYGDHPLSIYRDADGRVLSTISQPSLVLHMLDLLGIREGQTVFELGAGSGWNAALLSRLVGTEGSVVSAEIIEALVPDAQASLDALGCRNVSLIAGDAVRHAPSGVRFDRALFTASASDLPALFFDIVKPGGRLLFVLKARPDYDLLCVLEKAGEDHFRCEALSACRFVPVTGSSQPENLPARPFAGDATTEITWSELKVEPDKLEPLLAFLKLVFDCRQSVLIPDPERDYDEEFWAIQSDPDSTLLFNDDRLLLCGSEKSLITLRRSLKRWRKAGCPEVDELGLDIFRSGAAPLPSNDQWIAPRGDATLLWSVSAS